MAHGLEGKTAARTQSGIRIIKQECHYRATGALTKATQEISNAQPKQSRKIRVNGRRGSNSKERGQCPASSGAWIELAMSPEVFGRPGAHQQYLTHLDSLTEGIRAERT